MEDPISATILLNGGETARIIGPSAVKSYNPNLSADYAPNTPGTLDVIGVPELKIEDVEGAEGAYTFSATERPDILIAKASKLQWRGATWTILKVRNRYWLGKINGFTVYLAT